ncbi:MAG: cardiolipin synthase, partial [Verrucomicrobiota bacterium]
MAKKRARSAHWLNDRWWRLAIGEWIALTLFFLTLLHNGDEYFPAMLKAIQSTKKSINFEAFIVYSDSVGTQFRDALCERARSGVEVRMLLDG